MKKPTVPDTTGEATPDYVRAVKDNIDVITGRRNNKITLPTMQTLTFSPVPTQSEYQALNAYVNEWGKSLVALTARLDE